MDPVVPALDTMGHRPRSSKMALTPELVSLCSRAETDRGPDPRLTPLTDTEREAFARELSRESVGKHLWLFAYGSLIWKPEFEFVEKRRATVNGWHRSFCLEITNWRGTPGQPGLMMALDRGGRCSGVAYRLSDEDRPAQLRGLIKRELDYREDLEGVRWVTVRSGQEILRALVFWAGPAAVLFKKLPVANVAGILARACGHWGSCAEYLYNTVAHLERLGIHDRNLWRLQKLVAAEIRTIHGLNV